MSVSRQRHPVPIDEPSKPKAPVVTSPDDPEGKSKDVRLSSYNRDREINSVRPEYFQYSSPKAYAIWLIVVVILSFVIRFYMLDHPPKTAFDEVYFASFALNYVNHEYYFDIHPPMAKLTFSWLMRWIEFNNTHPREYKDIGTAYPTDGKYVYLRASTAFLSALTVILMFLICERSRVSLPSTLIATAFVLFDGCFHVMATKILTDSYLWFFQALSIYCALRFWQLEDDECEGDPKRYAYTFRWWFWCIACGFAMGHTCSVKWTGIGVIGAVGVRQIWRTFRVLLPPINRNWQPRVVSGVIGGVVMVGLIVVIYLIYWVIHFKTLTHTGPGDAFMSQRFQAALIGSKVSLPEGESYPSMIECIIETHKTMFWANSGLQGGHPYGADWLHWPLMTKGVLFYVEYLPQDIREVIYLMGNPFSWWASSFLLLCYIVYIIRVVYKDDYLPKRDYWYTTSEGWILFGFLSNYLPYSRITRTCFLYHYIPPLYWGIVLIGLFIDHMLEKQTYRWIAAAVLILPTIYVAYYFAPWIYGYQHTVKEYDARLWIPGWL